MTTTASVFEDQAAIFTTEVRAQLADLPSDELDELLDGLQADLTDRLTDGGELGDPELYAAELRQAAGLPPRSEGETTHKRRSLSAVIGDAGTDWAQKLAAFFDATPARQGIRDFVLSIRGVWWVVRGLVLAGVVLIVLGAPIYIHLTPSIPTAIFTLACVIVSVQWGREKWAPNRWLIALRRVFNAIAVVALLPMAALVGSISPSTAYVEPTMDSWGLNVGGESITNIFAYDCAGQPLEAVQLYDQNGDPLTTSRSSGEYSVTGWDETTQETILYFPNGAVIGDGQWNAFPLEESRFGASQDPYADTSAEEIERPKPAIWPFEERGPLNTECAADRSGAVAGADQNAEPNADADQGAGTETETDTDAGAAPTDPTSTDPTPTDPAPTDPASSEE